MNDRSYKVKLYSDVYTTKELLGKLWQQLMRRWWFRAMLIVIVPIIFLLPSPLFYYAFPNDPDRGTLGFFLIGCPIGSLSFWIVAIAVFNALNFLVRWIFDMPRYSDPSG